MTTRRSFLKQSALVGAGAMLSPAFASAAAKPFSRIGLQLYSLRADLPKDVRGVIGKIAKAGYTDVETYGYSLKDKFWGLTPKEFTKLLKDNGMINSSGHYGVEQLVTTGSMEDIKSYIDAAKIMESKYIVAPYLNAEVRKTADQWKGIADKLNKAGELCKSSGLRMAYHNHNFEFDKLADGSMGYDILLQQTDPKLVSFEMDLYWVVRAGHDPIKLFKEHPGRFVMWHVKDMNKTDPTEQTQVGDGRIDFKSIFAQAKLSGVKSFFVEQEDHYVPNPVGAVATSAAFLKKNLM
jgi:sugar phosphate isomerase/epimerase